MGMIFRQQTTRPIPASAELIMKAGKRFARWRSKGKLHTEPVTGTENSPRLTTTARFYSVRFRDHCGRIVVRSTGCRDRQAAEQLLAKWEREQEQIRAGVLKPGEVETAKSAAGSLDDHLVSYERSLRAREVSDVYLENALRAIRCLRDDLEMNCPIDLTRENIEPWFAKAVSEGMGARTRNYYRESIVLFANWLTETGRFSNHDLGKLPNADRRADPRRQRRALTEEEIGRLLAVALTRPLDDARTIRRGKDKGERTAILRPEHVSFLERLGRERVLIYRTLIFTGLRLNELRTLTVAQLDLARGAEQIQLEARHEKSGAGSTIPMRSDHAAELRLWIASKKLATSDLLFTVPAGLRRILDRDLKAAGIPKRDERGRTVDVHALRTTLGTMLSTSGTAPRTAQAAMRHSDIKLTMGTYTDPKLLNVREAMERLPKLLPSTTIEDPHVTLHVTPPTGTKGQNGSPSDIQAKSDQAGTRWDDTLETTRNVNENAPVSSADNTGAQLEANRADRIRTCDLLVPNQALYQAELQPVIVKRW